MPIRSSIDLGTNTCLLLVVDWDSNQRKIKKVLKDLSQVIRFGEGVDRNRRLSTGAMERARACLKTYAAEVQNAGGKTGETICAATSGSRDAGNSQAFFSSVKKELGFQFRVISGDEEAQASFQGALLDEMNPKNVVVIDIGGGSTEFVSQDQRVSLDIGSVRLTERHLKSDPVKDEEFWSCRAAIDQELDKLKDWRQTTPPDVRLLGVAGTITTLAAWFHNMPQFDSQKIDQTVLSKGDIHRMVEELKWRTVKERLSLPGVGPGRADVLLAGALILWRAMEKLGFAQTRVSSRGLRYGLIGNAH